MQSKDNDVDGIIDSSENSALLAGNYAEQLATQLKKGLLSYCVLLAVQNNVYTSEILEKLAAAELQVVEGTIYPLLARLQKDGLLTHIWQESPQGPPRKYYSITLFGQEVQKILGSKVEALNKSIKFLERSKK